jgi:hypothetical protein
MGVIITINGTVTEKRVFQGDVSLVQAALDAEKAATQGFNYQIFADENDPAFLSVISARTQDERDAQAARQYPDLAAFRNMTPAQAQAWVETNVVDFPSAKRVLKALVVMACIEARRI